MGTVLGVLLGEPLERGGAGGGVLPREDPGDAVGARPPEGLPARLVVVGEQAHPGVAAEIAQPGEVGGPAWACGRPR